MREAFSGLYQRLTFTKVTKTVVDFEVVETEDPRFAMGVRQPLSAQKLMMKPEGQRSWKWEMIHSTPELVLSVDEVIVFGRTRYRVMEKFDWKEYGYVEYHIVQDFTST